MRAVLSGCLAALFAVNAAHGAEAVDAATPGAPNPRFMFFSGGDVWSRGGFAHAGVLWSPESLYTEGFTLKVLGGAGTYLYRNDLLGTVTGYNVLGSIMPGWRFKFDRLEITAVVGLDLQHHTLRPDDVGNRMRGFNAGVRAGLDLWYEPSPSMRLAANVSASSIGPSFWSRIAAGWRAFDRLWLGPEALAMGDSTYQQVRAGLHVTSFKTGNFEWSAGAGYVLGSDSRSGPYVRFGVLTRM
jgi:Cellulose biosynthesis protein BcsS